MYRKETSEIKLKQQVMTICNFCKSWDKCGYVVVNEKFEEDDTNDILRLNKTYDIKFKCLSCKLVEAI